MVMLPGQKDRMGVREYHWRAGLFIYMLILLWMSTRTLMAYGCLVLHQSIVGVKLQATHTILGATRTSMLRGCFGGCTAMC